jgi:hypothetical protein
MKDHAVAPRSAIHEKGLFGIVLMSSATLILPAHSYPDMICLDPFVSALYYWRCSPDNNGIFPLDCHPCLSQWQLSTTRSQLQTFADDHLHISPNNIIVKP